MTLRTPESSRFRLLLSSSRKNSPRYKGFLRARKGDPPAWRRRQSRWASSPENRRRAKWTLHKRLWQYLRKTDSGYPAFAAGSRASCQRTRCIGFSAPPGPRAAAATPRRSRNRTFLPSAAFLLAPAGSSSSAWPILYANWESSVRRCYSNLVCIPSEHRRSRLPLAVPHRE